MFGRRKRPGFSRKPFTTVDEGISAPLRGLLERSSPPPGAARDDGDGPIPRFRPAAPVTPPPPGTGARTLVVGRKIRLNGEVASCEKLRIEGRLEAEVTDTQSLEIAETGSLKGSAVVTECLVRGEFEGNLTVQGRLRIGRGGRVRGAIRYAEIEIESGGQISGKVQLLSPRQQAPVAATGSRTAELGPAAPAGAAGKAETRTGGSGAKTGARGGKTGARVLRDRNS